MAGTTLVKHCDQRAQPSSRSHQMTLAGRYVTPGQRRSHEGPTSKTSDSRGNGVGAARRCRPLSVNWRVRTGHDPDKGDTLAQIRISAGPAPDLPAQPSEIGIPPFVDLRRSHLKSMVHGTRLSRRALGVGLSDWFISAPHCSIFSCLLPLRVGKSSAAVFWPLFLSV